MFAHHAVAAIIKFGWVRIVAKPAVGPLPDFYLQIQEVGGIAYNALRETIANLVQCGRKVQIVGPQAPCSQHIRDREMAFRSKRGSR